MNKIANVVFAYSPKNEDELELSVGDKIEVIGFEEEGWWKGKLKGRIGVFPSNFVQVVETGPIPSPSILSGQQSNNSNANKLPSIFGNKASKISLSSNSLNSNNSNSNNSTNNPIPSNNNNDHSTNNINNLTMNNTQDNSGLACNDDASNTSSERRQPKPVRAMGYGDIFAAAKTKPLPADPAFNMSGNTNDRSTSNYIGSLQKQIPKKPPPPTPITSSTNHLSSGQATPSTNSMTSDNTNGNFPSQAPALPPKPANQYSPHLQHSVLHPPPPLAPATQLQVREQAKVIYAYEPTNDDELAIEVGDIIDIIDKNIEDQGWWKGELRGRTGVFPDNFVKLIETPKVTQPQAVPSAATTNGPPQNNDWQHRASHHNMPPIPNFNANQTNDSNRIKSLFASTPKGFSKELENNLEKHNSQASFLSLKRNKIQQPPVSTEPESSMNETSKLEDLVGQLETSATKLNHITANRAKGPNRRLPSNVLNKRNQLDQQVKRELNGTVLASLPINSSSQSNNLQDSLSSLPAGPANNTNQPINAANTPVATKTIDATASNRKTSPVVDNILDNTPATPKTSQRFTQMSAALDKSKTSSTTTTPPWMVELKKAHADRKRDTPQLSSSVASAFEDEPVVETAASVTLAPMIKANQNHHNQQPPVPQQQLQPPQLPQLQQQHPLNQHQPQPSTQQTPPQLSNSAASVTGLSSAQYDNLIKMISKSVSGEIAELRDELKRLKLEVEELNETKRSLEVMKIELKTCQSATESQKKYIRDLVNNLADERKKIAAMQVEIDRNLK